jgi:hypothetical protein
MPRRRSPKPRISGYKRLKTAAGGSGVSGGGNGSGFCPGDNLVCRIVNTEPGGYAVIVKKGDLPGFLPTQALLRLGADIVATYVCTYNNRILVSARFSGPNTSMHTV